MTWYQEWFGEEYLELYSYRDDDEARQQVAFFLQQCGRVHGPVLDLACGRGRHMQELQAHGFRPVGCDLSYTMLRAGIAEYGLMPVARADMRQLPFGNARLAGLVNFFTSFGYFATEEENLEVVREMARVLEPDAPFLFDYLNVHRELEKLVQRETRETPMGAVKIERWFDGSDRSFNKRITIGKKRYLERVRGYDLDEISMMFTSCDLSIHSAFGDFTGAPYDRTSPRLILVGSRMR
ncbi:MAG TPA: class I SAM-dependent methyltransferase [Thermoanaerobaculia bacterium]|jgi:SAM-dependent methyltransferase|nr:class I SAM-dependent methyltransferase [Thermoanaerobaculia bacterium]